LFVQGTIGQDGSVDGGYLAQGIEYMMVLNSAKDSRVIWMAYPKGDEARDIIHVVYNRDLEMEQKQLETVLDFYFNHIIPRIPPEDSGISTDAYKAWVNKKHPIIPEVAKGDIGEDLSSVKDIDKTLGEYFAVSAKLSDLSSKKKELEEKRNAINQKLIEAMGDKTNGHVPMGNETVYLTLTNRTTKKLDLSALRKSGVYDTLMPQFGTTSTTPSLSVKSKVNK